MSKQNTEVSVPLEQPFTYSPEEENVYNEESSEDFQPLPMIWIPFYYITLLIILAGVLSLICLFCVDLKHISFVINQWVYLDNDTSVCKDKCKAMNDTFINHVNSNMWRYHPQEWDVLENQLYDTVVNAEPFTQKSCVADKEKKTITVVTASKSQPQLITSPIFVVYCSNRKLIKGTYNYDYTSRIGSYKPKGGTRIKHKDYVTDREEYPYAIPCLILTLISFIMFATATICVTFRLRTTSNYKLRRREGYCFCGKNDMSRYAHWLIITVIVIQVLIIVIMPLLFLSSGFALWRSKLTEKYNAVINDTKAFTFLKIFLYVCQFVALIGACLIHYFRL